MTSEAKRAANRANAQKSTGPRSREGKARSSQNATRHGLAKSAANDPIAQDRMAALAAALAGEGASSACAPRRRLVAEAQVDLDRARAARAHLQGQILGGPGWNAPRAAATRVAALGRDRRDHRPASTATSAAPCRAAARPCDTWTSCAPSKFYGHPSPASETQRTGRMLINDSC